MELIYRSILKKQKNVLKNDFQSIYILVVKNMLCYIYYMHVSDIDFYSINK